MELILTKDVKGKGKKGDIVSVEKGYARNYLLPNRLALIASKEALEELEKQKAKDAQKAKEELQKYIEIKNMLDGKVVDVYAKGGKEGKLYGSVTSEKVSEALNEKFNILVDKKKILLNEGEHISCFGVYECKIKFCKNVSVQINVNVQES